MNSLLRQCATVASMNLQSIPQRLWMSLANMAAVAVVVGVSLGLSALIAGFEATVKGSGAEDVAIVLRGGAGEEVNSVLGREQARLIAEAPGVARGPDGEAIASAELYLIVDGKRRGGEGESNLPLRGVGAKGLETRPAVQLVEGRMFAPGSNEIVVGRGLLSQFEGFELGSSVRLGANVWRIVGVFASPGSVLESELWADAAVVQSLFNRGASIQLVRTKLTSPAALEEFKKTLENDPRLTVEAKSERAYYADQSSPTVLLIRYINGPLGLILAIGALAGALNTMYSAVSARAGETATLRIFGFSGVATFFGTLAEALALSLAGGLIGLVVCYLAFNGASTSAIGSSFTQVVFALKVTPEAAGQALLLALGIGLLAGAFPAWRAARTRPLLQL